MKRLVLKLEWTSSLTDGDQDTVVGDVADIVDGDGIDGFFVANTGWGWLEMEGGDTDVDNAAGEVDNLEVVKNSTTVTDESISSSEFDHWYGAAAHDCEERN